MTERMNSKTYFVVQYYDPRGAWRECTEYYKTYEEARAEVKSSKYINWRIILRSDEVIKSVITSADAKRYIGG